jgi:hypothetical protein
MPIHFTPFWRRKKPEQNPGVYRIRNTVNGMEYIGSTTRTFTERWKIHRGKLNKNRHDNSRLQADWNHYGPDAFVFEVIEVVFGQEDVLRRERAWQAEGYDPRMRYNPPHHPGPKKLPKSRMQHVTDGGAPFHMETFRGSTYAALRPDEDADFWLAMARLVFSGRVSEADTIGVIDGMLRERGFRWTKAQIRARLAQEWRG